MSNKIGFIVTAHHSKEFRADGGKFLERFCLSLYKYCKYNFRIYVIDNSSTIPLNIPNDKNIMYTRIKDQTIEGITGAWNKGIYKAYEDGCDILINCNDDLWFNDTINMFIDFIISHYNENTIYGVLSDGILSGSQKSSGPLDGIQTKTCNNDSTCLNGFCFAMTKDHYEKYRFEPHRYFNPNNKHNGGDGKWGGQEGQFIENSEKGLTALIVNSCWLPHTKVRGWLQHKQ